MSAFCGLKMGTQTNQLKFTATHLLSLEEQVLHSSLTLQFFIIFLSMRKIKIQLFNLLLKTLTRRFTGTDDEDTAIQYYNISRQVMKDADMNLCQWFTNSPELTTIIDKMRTGSERDHAGLLGMMWNPKEDTLQFPRKAIVIPPDVKFTKRQVLSSASSTFDPIGLISPVLVPAKKFISSLG